MKATTYNPHDCTSTGYYLHYRGGYIYARERSCWQGSTTNTLYRMSADKPTDPHDMKTTWQYAAESCNFCNMERVGDSHNGIEMRRWGRKVR